MAMSDTVGPEELIPSILSFGSQPCAPIGNYEQMPQTATNRMDLMNKAGREYEAIMKQNRIYKELHVTTSNYTFFKLTFGDEVLVYRETLGWKGSYTYICKVSNVALVLNDKDAEQQLCIYFKPSGMNATHFSNMSGKKSLMKARDKEKLCL